MSKQRYRCAVHRVLRARGGVAAVEFALIAPLLILFLFGLVEATEVLNANRRVENVAASMADVVARDTIVDNADISDLWQAIEPLMFPDTANGFSARITSVVIQSATQAEVGWSRARGAMSAATPGGPFTLPSDLMTPGTSVIVAEVRYAYVPAINIVMGGAMTLEHTEYRRPRVVDPITFAN